MDNFKLQLRPCAFHAEFFLDPSGPYLNAEYIFSGIKDGFAIIDHLDIPGYHCTNYNSILDPSVACKMDEIVNSELLSHKFGR